MNGHVKFESIFTGQYGSASKNHLESLSVAINGMGIKT